MATTQATQVPVVEWQDVQGMVLRGYGKHPHSANLFLRIDDGARARAWLATLCDRVTTAERAQERVDDRHLNVAFTRSGLLHLGLTPNQLATFPTSFIEGMTSDTRSRILGDEQGSRPSTGTGLIHYRSRCDLVALREKSRGRGRSRESGTECVPGHLREVRTGGHPALERREGTLRLPRRRVAADDRGELPAAGTKPTPPTPAIPRQT